MAFTLVSLSALLKQREIRALFVKAISLASGFSTSVVLARCLGADIFGVYAYVLTCAMIALTVGLLGFDTASCRFVATYAAARQWPTLRGFFRRSRQIVLLASSATGAALGVGALLFIERLGSHIAWPLAASSLLLPCLAMLFLRAAHLQGLKHVFFSQFPLFVIRPVVTALAVLLLFFIFGQAPRPTSVVLCHVIGSLIALLGVEWALRRNRSVELLDGPCRFETAQWLRTCVTMFGFSAAVLLTTRINVLILGWLTNTTLAGVYVVASELAALVIVGLTAITVMAAPHMAELFNQRSREELQRVVSRTAVASLIVAVPICVALAVAGRAALGICFGTVFRQGYEPMLILAAGQLFNVAAGPVGILLQMTGHHTCLLRTFFIAAAINVVLTLLLVPHLQLVGAALAMAVSTIFWNSLLIVKVKTTVNINPTFFSKRISYAG